MLMKNNKIIAMVLCVFILITSCSVLALNERITILTPLQDITPPVTTCNLEGEKFGRYFIGEVILSLNAVDDESGVRETWIGIHLGGGAMIWEKYTAPLTISNIGIHTFDYWSIDNAGNREDTKTISFIIIEDIGLLLAVGDFTEELTRYTGNFSFMLFVGFDNREFNIIKMQDENLRLDKVAIIKEIVIKQNILFVKIVKFPKNI
jgi:hypothetical protein